MKIYISGGCKNGKTSYAQSAVLKLAKGRPHVYVATMTAKDDEDRARIAKHIEDRAGLGFITAEKSENIST
ncbi:MAG: bifunctional adenosylcobinamide kinase/adenosylcobinamide-phosphate guanylyltransferase, partial [Firmicutes bacterium]|nr:bifunctional adenosylcobinamide kinase/adenosylcobinamide-phosphate guanylyltransferase [Bacillota bacterium]